MSTSTNINNAMQLLRDRYRNELPEKLAEIGRLLDVLLRTDKFDTEEMKTLYRLVHGLKGSGATFGLEELSIAAAALDESIKEIMQRAVRLTDETVNNIRVQWNAVSLSAQQPEEKVLPQKAVEVQEKKSDEYILIVEKDVEQARNLERQLHHFGYSAKVLHDTTLLCDAVNEKKPSVIIMDVIFPEGKVAGPLSISGLPCHIQHTVPLIFISNRGDVEARLSAVRAGASAYFTKPVDLGLLVDKLDKLTSENLTESFKILIVDDAPPLAEYYSAIMQSAGMETVVVTDPLKVLDVLSDFTPELILMDMYMPGCSGLEMAKIIRQQEAYVSTPIVFLSAETDVEKQLEALQFGADDFLTKPIQPDHLLSSVTSRVQRYRTLRTFMVRDSLTGLLNHVKTKEELDTEIIRAQRQNNSLVFAMIDIDNFKSVNDVYGHPTGDRVIKSIARLLQQRLRKTDIVGRYGGEEFAVILKDTDAASAYATLDDIRKAFEKIAEHSDKGDFSVTFSCGLAEFPQFANATDICNAADRALYEAKDAGRNRVVIAQSCAAK